MTTTGALTGSPFYFGNLNNDLKQKKKRGKNMVEIIERDIFQGIAGKRQFYKGDYVKW